jgi:cell pole-organizing protein PopZ
MEEILASIRRIIADDQDRAPRLRPELPPEPTLHEARPAVAPAPKLLDDVIPPVPEAPPVAEPVAEAEPGFSDFEAADLDDARFEAEPEPEAVSPPVAAEAHPVPPAGLVSAAAGAAVAGSFERLAVTLHPPQPARTMEEHVSEMLRPMLQAWLDENLPALVESLVEAEIERLARQRR